MDALSARLLEGTEGGHELVIVILEKPVGAQRLLLVAVALVLLPLEPGADNVVQEREKAAVASRADPKAFAIGLCATIAAAQLERVGVTASAGVTCSRMSVLWRIRRGHEEYTHCHRGGRRSAHKPPK